VSLLSRSLNCSTSSALSVVGLLASKIEFRTFAHPRARMLAVVEERGLRRAYAHHPLVWQIAGFER
jgi:hypothetical protein